MMNSYHHLILHFFLKSITNYWQKNCDVYVIQLFSSLVLKFYLVEFINFTFFQGNHHFGDNYKLIIMHFHNTFYLIIDFKYF